MPPARMKRRSGGSSASSRSISCFEPRDVVVADDRLGHARGELARRDRRAGRRARTDRAGCWTSASSRSGSSVDGAHEAEPGVQLVDLAVRVDARVGFAARACRRRATSRRRRRCACRFSRSAAELYEMRRRSRRRAAKPLADAGAADRRRFRQRLLTWYRRHGRDLPWRKTDDPYHILVSEIMLQQTQVDRVLPKYAEWLDKYPSLEALAAAPEREVTDDLVSARLQHPAAAAADDRARIGRATTAASCRPTRRRCCRSRASAPTPPARSAASRSASAPPSSTPTSRACCSASSSAKGDPKSHAMKRHLWTRLRDARAASRHVFDFNQALMDFGAMVCVARNPKCLVCPMAKSCRALPVRPRPLMTTHRRHRRGHRARRPLSGHAAAAGRAPRRATGSFPAANASRARRSAPCLARELREELDVEASVGDEVLRDDARLSAIGASSCTSSAASCSASRRRSSVRRCAGCGARSWRRWSSRRRTRS